MYNHRIPIFYYHSVAPRKDPRWYKSYLTFELKYFTDLLRYLKTLNFEFLYLDEYFQIKNNQHQKKKKQILLTFDDGFLDNYVYIFPLLKKYGAKATIFVNPEFVQELEKPREVSEPGRYRAQESLGYLSWAEMKEMESSGLVDIQSHSLTHTKYYTSDRIINFHNPGSDYLNPISNLFPDRKPYYILDKEFKNLIPYGTPFFEEKPALIAKKVDINQSFVDECVKALKETDWQSYDFEKSLVKVSPIYEEYVKNDTIIVDRESEQQYIERVKHELTRSKEIIESKLDKVISHCCWPSGGYNETCHKIAREVGYKSTTIILKPGEENLHPDRFDRTGAGSVKGSRILTLLKALYKIYSYMGKPPFSWINKIYYKLRYGKY